MHKEVLAAIIFGSLLGLVVAFGIWKANSALRLREAATAEQRGEPSETEATGVKKLDLSLTKPTDRQVATNSPLMVEGISSMAQYLAVSGEEGDVIMKPNEKGEFKAEVGLTGGVNEIAVTALSNNELINKSMLVIYTTQLVKGSTEEKTGEASGESEIEEAAKEKAEAVLGTPRAYLGTVTDITEGSVQIRSNEGEIKQITLGEKTNYANIVKEAKEVGFEDMAIGDYVIAIGYPSAENGILEAARMLITTPREPSGREAQRGKVSKVAKSIITIESGGKEWKIDTAGKITLTKEAAGEGEFVKAILTEIKEGDEIIVAGVQDENSIKARTIHIIFHAQGAEE